MMKVPTVSIRESRAVLGWAWPADSTASPMELVPLYRLPLMMVPLMLHKEGME